MTEPGTETTFGGGRHFGGWDASDLDRCEHGRHSTDSCVHCSDGMSSGNLFLMGLARGHHAEMTAQLAEGLVRIGTTLYGAPILINPNRRMP